MKKTALVRSISLELVHDVGIAIPELLPVPMRSPNAVAPPLKGKIEEMKQTSQFLKASANVLMIEFLIH